MRKTKDRLTRTQLKNGGELKYRKVIPIFSNFLIYIIKSFKFSV
jgi:hypothetical protein